MAKKSIKLSAQLDPNSVRELKKQLQDVFSSISIGKSSGGGGGSSAFTSLRNDIKRMFNFDTIYKEYQKEITKAAEQSLKDLNSSGRADLQRLSKSEGIFQEYYSNIQESLLKDKEAATKAAEQSLKDLNSSGRADLQRLSKSEGIFQEYYSNIQESLLKDKEAATKAAEQSLKDLNSSGRADLQRLSKSEGIFQEYYSNIQESLLKDKEAATKAAEQSLKKIQSESRADLSRLSKSDSILQEYYREGANKTPKNPFIDPLIKAKETRQQRAEERRILKGQGYKSEFLSGVRGLGGEDSKTAKVQLERKINQIRLEGGSEVQVKIADAYKEAMEKVLDQLQDKKLSQAKELADKETKEKVEAERSRNSLAGRAGAFAKSGVARSSAYGLGAVGVAGASASYFGGKASDAVASFRTGRRARAELRNRQQLDIMSGNYLEAGAQEEALNKTTLNTENIGNYVDQLGRVAGKLWDNPLRALNPSGVNAEARQEVTEDVKRTLLAEDAVPIQAFKSLIQPNVNSRFRAMRGTQLSDNNFNSFTQTGAQYGIGQGEVTGDMSNLIPTLGQGGFNGGPRSPLLRQLYQTQNRFGMGVQDQAQAIELMTGRGGQTDQFGASQRVEEMLRRGVAYGLDSSKTSESLQATSDFIQNNASYADINMDAMQTELLKQARAFADLSGRENITSADIERARNVEQQRRAESMGRGGGLDSLGNYLNVIRASDAAKSAGGQVDAFQFMAMLNMSNTADKDTITRILKDLGMGDESAGAAANILEPGKERNLSASRRGLGLKNMTQLAALQSTMNQTPMEQEDARLRAMDAKDRASAIRGTEGLVGAPEETASGKFVVSEAIKQYEDFANNFNHLNTVTGILTSNFGDLAVATAKIVSAASQMNSKAGATNPATRQSQVYSEEVDAKSPRIQPTKGRNSYL